MLSLGSKIQKKQFVQIFAAGKVSPLHPLPQQEGAPLGGLAGTQLRVRPQIDAGAIGRKGGLHQALEVDLRAAGPSRAEAEDKVPDVRIIQQIPTDSALRFSSDSATIRQLNMGRVCPFDRFD